MEPETPWITVGALAHAFSEESYAPRPTADLAGRHLTFHLADGAVVDYGFTDETQLTWAVSAGPGAGSGGAETYFAATLRQGIYFVDHLDRSRSATAVTLLLDLGRGIATLLTARLPEESESRQPFAERIAQGKDLTAVSVDFALAAVNKPFSADTPRHEPTVDMVGRRMEYTYSPTERYEHIYLNERFYTWHCLLGSEKGLADTDRCHYYKLADDLYFFVWREKIVPTLGAVVVDFAAMRTTGKIFGYKGDDPGALSNFPVGAWATRLGGSPIPALADATHQLLTLDDPEDGGADHEGYDDVREVEGHQPENLLQEGHVDEGELQKGREQHRAQQQPIGQQPGME